MDNCLAKVVHTIEIVVLNIPNPVWITMCPTRFKLQTLWTGVILTRKINALKTFYAVLLVLKILLKHLSS